MISTSITGVSAASSTLPLVAQFLSCSAASKWISSSEVEKPLSIEATKQSFAETITDFDKTYKPKKIKILIPETHLHSNEGLADLVFEIFNAGTEYVKLQGATIKKARAGDLSMDQFAKDTETNENRSNRARARLKQQCPEFQLAPSAFELSTEPLEILLFTQDIDCHTDFYRSDWIDLYQKAYCDKHPEEDRSCKTKKSDLCDLDQVERMPQEKKQKIYANRICKLYPQAVESVKTRFQSLFQKHCSKKKIRDL